MELINWPETEPLILIRLNFKDKPGFYYVGIVLFMYVPTQDHLLSGILRVINPVPVIDIFAGAGGLGEGFSSFQSQKDIRTFKLVLSIEKEEFAWQTLRLRNFFRHFDAESVPEIYYKLIRNEIEYNDFLDLIVKENPIISDAWQSANNETLMLELGSSQQSQEDLDIKIKNSLRNCNGIWLLVGGPPCQAYSIAGRVRNKGKENYKIEEDHRSTLYLEYLRIISKHWPAVFVMENVKGILSANVNNEKIFERIIKDLSSPADIFNSDSNHSNSYQYEILPIVETKNDLFLSGNNPRDFIVSGEQYGIPQKRDRVILIGIRSDLLRTRLPRLKKNTAPSVNDIIADLPRLRSGISNHRNSANRLAIPDSFNNWVDIISGSCNQLLNIIREMTNYEYSELSGFADQLISIITHISENELTRGGVFVSDSEKNDICLNPLISWYKDKRLKGFPNHHARSHMAEDLKRYLFASVVASVTGVSPKLAEFPAFLQPNHKNAASGDFTDRFRVQVANKPATTITSHISKDGHYFIHPDPHQCRSLTVREAARIQTFQDNYYFCGPRTAQYMQVGNAVPPLLARQIAGCIHEFLLKNGAIDE